SDEINSAVITPDGSTMYFTTNRTGHGYDNGWQLRAADVSTGRLRVVGRYAGLPVFLTADPSVGRILEGIEFPPRTAPSPVPSASPTRSLAPSGTASPAPSATRSPMPSVSGSPVPSPSLSRAVPSRTGSPVPSPSLSRAVPSRTGSPVPSPSLSRAVPPRPGSPAPSPSLSRAVPSRTGSPVPSQTGSPVPSATRSPVPSPSPTQSGGQPPARMRVALIDLGTGSLIFPQWQGWPDQAVIFTW